MKTYKLVKEYKGLDGTVFKPQVLEVSENGIYYMRSTKGDILSVGPFWLKNVEYFIEGKRS